MLPVLDPTTLASSGKCLGAGVHRTAYDVNGVVIKIANGSNGMVANTLEGQSWDHVQAEMPEVAHLFAPVLAFDPGGYWLVMSKAKNVGMMWYGGSAEIEALEHRGIVSDLHAFNCGEIDGQPVIIDYGFGVATLRLEGGIVDLSADQDEDGNCLCDGCRDARGYDATPEDTNGDGVGCRVNWGGIFAQCDTCGWYLGGCNCSGCQRHLRKTHGIRATRK